MDVKKYLKRLGFVHTPHPDLETLRALQELHIMKVPFENLDILSGERIVLDSERLFSKIVEKQRGGICYELNGLFYELLNAIGFEVKRVSGRVFDDARGFGPEFDHVAIVARVDNRQWLVDVGFGEFSFTPLELTFAKTQSDERGEFTLEQYDANHVVVKRMDDAGSWHPQYLFTLVPRALHEFDAMCHYHQTSEQSHFTRNRLCSLATRAGRITLTDSSLRIREGTQIVERAVGDAREFERNLEVHFGIRLET